MPPDISCVIPTYNDVFIIDRCLSSVVHQQNIKFEIIVCDDTATNEVKILCDYYAKKYNMLRYVIGARTGNAVDNWNKGLAQANGRYLLLIHQDEFLLDQNHLQKIICALDGENARACVTRSITITRNRMSWFPLVAGAARLFRPPLWTLFMLNWIGPTATVAFSRDVTPLFNPKLKFMVDVDFYWRLLRAKGVVFINQPKVVSLAHHDAQISATAPRNATILSEMERNIGAFGDLGGMERTACLFYFRIRALLNRNI